MSNRAFLSQTSLRRRAERRSLWGRSPSRQELAQFFSEMALLCGSGIDILRALDICARQGANALLCQEIQRLSLEVRTGARLSQGMAAAPRIFTKFHASTLAAAEEAGDLQRAFADLAQWEEKEERLSRQLRAALSYPILVSAISVVGLYVLIRCLAPLVESTLAQSGKPPALATKVLLVLSRVAEHPGWMLLVGLIGFLLGLGVRAAFRRPRVRALWESLRIAAPLAGSMIRKTIVIRFSRSLGALLEAGIPLDRALELAGPSTRSIWMQDVVLPRTVAHVRGGEALSQALGDIRVLPPAFHGMLSIGEESGKLPHLLRRLGDLYELELDLEMQACLRVLEPLTVAVVGGLVLGVMLCAFLPLYELLGGLAPG